MSKQSEAKAAQGWQKKPNVCAGCEHFASVVTEEKGHYGTWTKEANMRCTLGGFKTGKSNVCREFKAKRALA